MPPIRGRSLFCSWSGGKDCCLALHRAVGQGASPLALVTMLREDGERSRSHGLSTMVLRAQAEALGVELVTRTTSWDGYRDAFMDALKEVRSRGADLGVFGDIDLQGHRDWVEGVCSEAGVEPLLPLWEERRETLLAELLRNGYEAMIVAVKDSELDPGYLGRTLSEGVVEDLRSRGIDLSGEAGEYHTLVVNGPLFRHPLRVRAGGVASKDGHSFLELGLP